MYIVSSWHEIGIYDLPAMMDYVLKKTNANKLHYIGHSQGWTTIMALLSTKPEWNSKIMSAHGLAPVTYLGNCGVDFVTSLARRSQDIAVSLYNITVNYY